MVARLTCEALTQMAPKYPLLPDALRDLKIE
jgi:hypothetical protein